MRTAANARGLQSKLAFWSGKPHLKNPFKVVMMLTWLKCSLLRRREVQEEEGGTRDFAKVCGSNRPLEAPPP